MVEQFSTIFVMVFGGEVLADWIKHGFIIKFNQLTPSIYEEYSTILARYGNENQRWTQKPIHAPFKRAFFGSIPEDF